MITRIQSVVSKPNVFNIAFSVAREESSDRNGSKNDFNMMCNNTPRVEQSIRTVRQAWMRHRSKKSPPKSAILGMALMMNGSQSCGTDLARFFRVGRSLNRIPLIENRTGVNIRAFPASLQGRRAVVVR